MKALVLHELKQPLTMEDRPDLEPAAGEVLIQLHAAALNRRDYWVTQGMYPGVKTPVVLGSDGAGVVVKVGDGVGREWVGREVIINPGLNWGVNPAAQSGEFHILGMPRDGTFATQVVVPAASLHLRPAHLTWHKAAALPLGGVTAYRAVFTQGRLQAGEKVLINGVGGGVATFALQYALAACATALVTSSSADKIERAIDMGATAGFQYTAGDWHKQLLSQHGPVDLIIDGAGGESYATLIELAAPGGRIVNYGATAGPPKRFDLFKVFWKQLHVIGSTMGSPDDFSAMLRLVTQHAIEPIVDQVFALRDGNQAVARMKDSPQFGKVVLEIETG